MKVFTDIAQWQLHRNTLTAAIGLVPTMGNLHLGHLSLVEKSQLHNDITVVSIFINPTQFNQREDFERYPRTLKEDLALLERAGVDYVLVPEPEDILRSPPTISLAENELSLLMEGQHRPGHFNGVMLIVLILFQIVKPQRAYFGEKDYQQLLILKKMVYLLFLPVELLSCPTIRESSGLAYSSRNNLLSAEQRVVAENFARIFHQSVDIDLIRQQLGKLALVIDYLEVYLDRVFVAVKVGDIRLIDNKQLED